MKKISQSLAKNLHEFKWGNECGLQLKARYIDNVEFPSTDAMDIGNWFEYECTGALPRNGKVPEPKMSYVGTKRECLSAPYKKMSAHIGLFHQTLKDLDWKIEDVGYSFNHPEWSGIADIVARNKDGQRIIIDLKSSGLINDKWSDMGWHKDSIESNEKLLIQAVQYKLLANHEWGEENIPFYFMVFSSVNDIDAVIYEVETDPDRIGQHDMYLKQVKHYFENVFMKLSDEQLARAEYKRCMKCPLFDTCNHRTSSLVINKIQF